jgi:hypothetical protein
VETMNPGDEQRGHDSGSRVGAVQDGPGRSGPERAVRVVCERLVEELAAHDPGGLAADELAVRRVAHARRARDLVERVAEEVLDDAVLAARRVGPAGVAWARLGRALGVTGQAVGQRLRARHPDVDLSRRDRHRRWFR